jgi:hypothetical protein
VERNYAEPGSIDSTKREFAALLVCLLLKYFLTGLVQATIHQSSCHAGGVGEWLKPAVLKTVRPQKGSRGFESHPLRQSVLGFLRVPNVSQETSNFGPIISKSPLRLLISAALSLGNALLRLIFSRRNCEVHFQRANGWAGKSFKLKTRSAPALGAHPLDSNNSVHFF